MTRPIARQPNAQIRADQKANLHANARYSLVMERRVAEGRKPVAGAVCRSVLGALINRSDQDGRCHPSVERIALESDVTVRTVLRVLDVLEEEGIVTRARRNHVAGLSKRDSSNVYTVVWSALEDCATGGRLTMPAGPPIMRQEVTRSGDTESRDQVTPTTGSGDTGDGITCLSRRAHKEEPPMEPPMEPSPPTPRGGDGGGVGAEARQPSAEQPTSVVDEILAAYPPTPGALPVSDTEAVQRAIAAERARADGASAAEILDAVRAYADAVVAGHVRSPLWCRRWMAERGYEPYVRRARGVEAARRDLEQRVDATRRAVDEQALETTTQVEAVDAILADRTIDELESVRSEIVADQPNEFTRRVYRDADVRHGSIVRREIARRLAARQREEVPACN